MHEIIANVTLDGKIFRKFATFDTLVRTKRIGQILLFTGIMLFFSMLSVFIGGADARTLTITLAGIGLFLPILYLGTFFRSVRYQIERNGLRKGRFVYRLHLTTAPDGVEVKDASEQSARYEWDKLYGAYRVKNATYLYVIKNQAFLLPNRSMETDADALWHFLGTRLPPEKLHDRRK